MIRILCVVAALAFSAAAQGADEIRTIESWTDYRAYLVSNGLAADEADAQIAEDLGDLNAMDRPATSVTFLVDKAGVIQFVRPGMEYHLAADTDVNQDPAAHAVCSADMSNIEATIKRLLAE